jgi:hypothetical protein
MPGLKPRLLKVMTQPDPATAVGDLTARGFVSASMDGDVLSGV